jgi:hypothetical protein
MQVVHSWTGSFLRGRVQDSSRRGSGDILNEFFLEISLREEQ